MHVRRPGLYPDQFEDVRNPKPNVNNIDIHLIDCLSTILDVISKDIFPSRHVMKIDTWNFFK